jgi:curved DNA-binding protein CbpA
MAKIHTHYDNLKVTRNAPPEIIRAAYKSLSQKFHPDRNPNNPAATQTIQLINLAYEVLSDPVKRTEHDRWIAKAEGDDQTGGMSPASVFTNVRTLPKKSKPVWRKMSFSMRRKNAYQTIPISKKSKPDNVKRIFKSFFVLISATLIFFGILGG